MNCEGYEIQISQMIDHELDDSEAGRLFGHMSGCRSCREFYRSSLRLRTMLLDSESMVRSEIVEHRENIHRRIPNVQKQSPTFLRGSISLSRIAAAIIAILMLVIGGITSTLWFQTGKESSRSSVEYIMTYPPIEVRGFLTTQPTIQ